MSKIDAPKIVDEFNEKYPSGSCLYWLPVKGDESTYQLVCTRSQAFVSASGTPVVFLEDKRGYCSIEPEHISKNQTPRP